MDLLHHTAYPIWLSGFDDPRFGDAYLEFCERFAKRYPTTNEYTLFNEPFTTMFLCGHEGVWPPYGRGMDSFVALSNNVLPAFFEATRMFADLLPNALHLYVEPCEGHAASITEGNVWSKLANDRRFFVIDRLLGRKPDPSAPFVAELASVKGGEELIALRAGKLDVLGLDYYAHMEWYHADDGLGSCPSTAPVGLARLIMQYWERYSLPMILDETNIRGYASDRASWLKYTLELCELAQSAGVPVPRPENAELYKRYKALTLTTPGVHFVGRLATYKYYNMDQVTAQALAVHKRLHKPDRNAELFDLNYSQATAAVGK